jgi:hypothetical protein
MEERKVLTPHVQSDGTHVFDPEQVQRVAAERAARRAATGSATANERGGVAARVFKRLDAGETMTSIVVHEQLAPNVVRDLAAEWRELKAADLNAPSVPGEVAELRQLLDEDRAWQQSMADAFAQLNEVVNELRHHARGPLRRTATSQTLQSGVRGTARRRTWPGPR